MLDSHLGASVWKFGSINEKYSAPSTHTGPSNKVKLLGFGRVTGITVALISPLGGAPGTGGQMSLGGGGVLVSEPSPSLDVAVGSVSVGLVSPLSEVVGGAEDDEGGADIVVDGVPVVGGGGVGGVEVGGTPGFGFTGPEFGGEGCGLTDVGVPLGGATEVCELLPVAEGSAGAPFPVSPPHANVATTSSGDAAMYSGRNEKERAGEGETAIKRMPSVLAHAHRGGKALDFVRFGKRLQMLRQITDRRTTDDLPVPCEH